MCGNVLYKKNKIGVKNESKCNCDKSDNNRR